MSYEITNITLSLQGNYLVVETTQESPEGELLLPIKTIRSYFPKSNTTFCMTYALISDGKTEQWTVNSVDIIQGAGQNVYSINHSIIDNERVIFEKEPMNVAGLELMLVSNTGA